MDITQQIGFTKQDAAQASKGGFATRVAVSDVGTYLHRVLGRPKEIHSIWIPTMMKNDDEMWIKARRQQIRPIGDCIIDEIVKLDLAVQRRDKQIENPKSCLGATIRWWFLIFDRDNEVPGAPEVVIGMYPQTVYRRLLELEQMTDARHPEFLRYGLIPMWDAIIEHKFDQKKKGPAWTKHSYTAEVGTFDWNGKVSISERGAVMSAERVQEIFEEEELEAMRVCDIDIDTEARAKADPEFIEWFKENPLNIWEVDERDGEPSFYGEFMVDDLLKMGITLVDPDWVDENGNPEDPDAPSLKVLSPEGTTSVTVEEDVEEEEEASEVEPSDEELPEEEAPPKKKAPVVEEEEEEVEEEEGEFITDVDIKKMKIGELRDTATEWEVEVDEKGKRGPALKKLYVTALLAALEEEELEEEPEDEKDGPEEEEEVSAPTAAKKKAPTGAAPPPKRADKPAKKPVDKKKEEAGKKSRRW